MSSSVTQVASPTIRAHRRPDPKPFPHAADLLGSSSESQSSSSSSMDLDQTPRNDRLRSIRERLDRETARLRERLGNDDPWAGVSRDFMSAGYVSELGYPQPYSPPSAFRPHRSSEDIDESVLRAAGPAMIGSLRAYGWNPPVATDRPSSSSVPIDSFASSTARLRQRAREQVPVSDVRERRRDPSAPDFDSSDATVPPPRSSPRNLRDRLARLDALREQGERLTPAHDWVGRPPWIGTPSDEDMMDVDLEMPTMMYTAQPQRPTANLPSRAREERFPLRMGGDRSHLDRSHLFGEIPIDTVQHRSRTTDPLALSYRALPSAFVPLDAAHPFHRRAIPAGGEFDYYHLNHHMIPQRSQGDAFEFFSHRAARLTAMGLEGPMSPLELRNDMDSEERKAVIEMVVKGVPKLPPPTRKKAAESMLETLPWFKVDLECKDEYCSVCHDEYHDETVIAVTPCKHMYHQECLSTWLNTPNTSSCPMCRRDLAVLACLTRMVPSKKREDAIPLWFDTISFVSPTPTI